MNAGRVFQGLVFSWLLIAGLQSCGEAPKPKSKQEQQATDTAHFYPLDVYFKEQIDYVDLRGFNIARVTVKDGKKDSSAIDKATFLAMAQTFQRYNIAAPQVKALYRETSFSDLSTGSLTLNYQPTNKNAVVQNVDVLLDEQGRAVKRVLIRAVYNHGDTVVTDQCSWKSYKSFQLNRHFEAPGYQSTELNFVNWNDRNP